MSFIVKPNGSKFLLWSLLVIVLDQVTKYLIMANYPVNSVAFHVTSFFSIVHVHNQGAAFSFLASQAGWQRYFFIAVAALISIVLFIAILRTHKQKIWTNLAIAPSLFMSARAVMTTLPTASLRLSMSGK